MLQSVEWQPLTVSTCVVRWCAEYARGRPAAAVVLLHVLLRYATLLSALVVLLCRMRVFVNVPQCVTVFSNDGK